MKPIRILVSGPLGAGKTTFVSTLCSSNVFISTDRAVTSPIEKKYKDVTTVAFDFGVTRYSNVKLMLYGTPGQQRFFYFIPILMRQCEYLLFLVDSSSVASVYRGRALFERYFRRKLGHFKNFLIVANKTDLPNPLPLEEIAEIMNVNLNKIAKSVAKDKNSCLRVISKLLEPIKAKLMVNSLRREILK